MEFDIAIAGVLSFLSAQGLFAITSAYNKQKNKIEELKSAKVYYPSSLMKKFKDQELSNKLSQNPVNPKEYKMNAFVEGIVTCKNPLKSKLNKKDDLVYSHVKERTIRSNDFLMGSKYKTVSKNAPLDFNLKDPDTSQTVRVHRNMNVKTHDVLEKVAENSTMKKLNPVEDLLVQIGQIFGFIGFFLKDVLVSDLFRGIHLGYNEVENGITVGSPLMAYGEVVYNVTEGTLRMETPLDFLKDKLSIIDEDYFGYYFGGFLVGAVFCASTFYAIYHYLKKRKNQKELK